MKNYIRLRTKMLLSLIFLLAFSPLLAIADISSSTATSTYYYGRYGRYQTSNDGSSESGAVRQQRIRGYRQQTNDLQNKIGTLSAVANNVVTMPVLFGVNVKDLAPNFGDPRDGGARTHEGEDIMATKGTPIVSPTSAVVIRTGFGDSEGNYVYTANPGGETFVYMHLDKIGEGVVSGLLLAQGALIGYVGNTGNASGGAAHLHFEIHNNSNAPTDPFPRLTGELSLQEKIGDLNTILGQTSDSAALSQFLVSNFKSTFVAALAEGIILPSQINGLLGIASNPVNPSSSLNLALSRDLYLGITGEDVFALQKFLNSHGYVIALSGAGSSGNETNYFGALTKAAVIRFQIAHNISPTAGYVGPITRGVLSTLAL